MRRRTFLGYTSASAAALGLGLTGCSSASEEAQESAGSLSKEDIVLVLAVRSLSNPYHANWVKGAELWAGTEDLEVQVLSDEGDSQKQLSQIRALLAGDKKVVLNVDPNGPADTQAIVKAVVDAGGFVSTHWNKPDDLHPWDVSDQWAAHVSFDGTVGGKGIAEALFEKMEGKGNIIALQGILDNVPAKQRFAGLQAALEENPDITLLDDQAADWNRNNAFEATKTLLAKHKGEVDGVWAANDDMALGAIEALKSEGLDEKVWVVGHDAVPEALDLLEAGDTKFVATVTTDAYWQGGAMLALAYRAAVGEYDVAAAGNEDREFYGEQFVVTADNIAEYTKEPTLEDYQADFDDPLARNTGPIE